MRFNFIDKLENISLGDNYFKDNTGKINILCYTGCLKIVDYDNLKYYSKNTCNENSVTVYKNILEDNFNITDVKSLIEVLSKDEEFKTYSFEKNKVFNPFIKKIDGKLKIKPKGFRLTKAQIKKILTHKDTEVTIMGKYSDDYAYDNAMKFFKGVKISRLEALYDVFYSFDFAYINKEDNSVSLTVIGKSKDLKVENKNFEFI